VFCCCFTRCTFHKSRAASSLAYLSAKSITLPRLSNIFAFHFFDFINLLKEREEPKIAPFDLTAICLYISLALLLALSSSDSFVCSYPLASQSTLNLTSTPLLFDLPLSTSQLSSILHSLYC